MTDTEYMQIALGEAQKAYNEGEIPIGAVLVYKDIILAADHNRCEADEDPMLSVAPRPDFKNV